MMGYGFGGFLAGLVFYGKNRKRSPAVLAVFGFLTIQLIVGPLLDCCTVFTTGSKLTWKYVVTVFAAGLPYNFKHALACAVTMLLFSKPLLGKLDRLINKYGMMNTRLEA